MHGITNFLSNVPNLKVPYKKIIAAREKLNTISGTHKAAYKKGHTNGKIFLKPFVMPA